jgi:hypothetical protein
MFNKYHNQLKQWFYICTATDIATEDNESKEKILTSTMSPATKSRRPPPRREDRRPSARDGFARSDIGPSDMDKSGLLMTIKGDGGNLEGFVMLCWCRS